MHTESSTSKQLPAPALIINLLMCVMLLHSTTCPSGSLCPRTSSHRCASTPSEEFDLTFDLQCPLNTHACNTPVQSQTTWKMSSTYSPPIHQLPSPPSQQLAGTVAQMCAGRCSPDPSSVLIFRLGHLPIFRLWVVSLHWIFSTFLIEVIFNKWIFSQRKKFPVKNSI